MVRLFFLVLLASLVVLCTGLGHTAINDETLILYLPFDEGDGKIAADQSQYGHDADLIKNVEWVEGKYGQAVEVMGRDMDIIKTAPADTLQIEGEITLMAWIKAVAWTGEGHMQVIGKNNHNGGEHTSYGLATSGDGTKIQGLFGAGAARPTMEAPAALELEEWLHIVASYDGATMKAYLNGELIHEEDQKFDFQGTNDSPVRIGCSKDRPQYTFSGAIDEAVVFSRALNLDEIKEVMEGGLLSVSPTDKLATTWATLKNDR